MAFESAAAACADEGFTANGATSRIRARRSVYLNSSTRRWGRPLRLKVSKASARDSTSPGSVAFAASNACTRAVSVGVLINVSCAMSGGLDFAIIRVAVCFELDRQFLAA